MQPSSSAQRWLVRLAATLSATLGAPIALVVVLFLVRVASFTGACGGYPSHIAAYPCAFDDYVAGFVEPHATIRLIVLSFLTATAALVLSAVGGLVWVLASARPAR